MIDFIFIVISFGMVMLLISLSSREYILTLFSGLIILVSGVYMGVNGVGSLTSFFTQSFAAILIGVGAYIIINASIQKMNETEG